MVRPGRSLRSRLRYRSSVTARLAPGMGLLCLLLLFIPGPFNGEAAGASDSPNALLMAVESTTVDIDVGTDGSALVNLSYRIAVRDASPIPFTTMTIDAMNDHVDRLSAVASVDGVALSPRARDDAPGFLVPLGDHAIEPGAVRTINLTYREGAAVFTVPGGGTPEQAEALYRLTAWDPDSVDEVIGIEVRMLLPPKVLDPGEAGTRRGIPPVETGTDPGSGRVMMRWTLPSVRPDRPPTVAAIFPRSGVDRAFDPYWDIQFAKDLPWVLVAAALLTIPAGILLRQRAVRTPYERPRIEVEGLGPRTSLSPVEAALLLDLPEDDVGRVLLATLMAHRALRRGGSEGWDVARGTGDGGGRGADAWIVDPGRAPAGPVAELAGLLRPDLRIDRDAWDEAARHIRANLGARLAGFSVAETRTHYLERSEAGWAAVAAAPGPLQDVKARDELPFLLLDPGAPQRLAEAVGPAAAGGLLPPEVRWSGMPTGSRRPSRLPRGRPRPVAAGGDDE